MTTLVPYRSRQRPHGFTLIELLVTLTIAAVLASLAAPSIRDFIVRGKMTNLSNEFTAGVMKSRSEAVNRNTCVTLCMSSSADKDANDSTKSKRPACTQTNSDWQVGWIAFLNPSCDGGINRPTDPSSMLIARPAIEGDYILEGQGSSPSKKIMFTARGSPSLGNAGQFDIIYKSVNDPMTTKYGLNICFDSLGRTRTIPSDKNCNQY